METKDLEKEQVEQLKLKIGARYIHNKTSNEYIIDSITKMKHPDTGEWIPAVIYKQVSLNPYGEEDLKVVREILVMIMFRGMYFAHTNLTVILFTLS